MQGQDVDDAFLDLLQESVFTRDPGGCIRSWNRASELVYGWSRNEAIGRDAHLLLQSSHAVPVDELDAEARQRGTWVGTMTRRTKAGDSRLIDVRWSVRDRPDQGTSDILETGRDVTEQRRAAAELRRSEHRYRNMFQAMAASFWELDFFPVGAMLRQLRADGVTDYAVYFRDHPGFVREMMRATRVIDVNDQTVALFGNGSRDGLMTSLEVFWPEDCGHVYAASVVAAVTGKPSYAAETVLRTLDGRRFDALFTACFPLDTMNKGTLLVGVIDISDRVRAQAAVLSLQAEFAHAARVSMLGELTASIAHEVNQPLGAIAASGEAGLRWLNRAQPDLDEVRALTARIVSDARRAADVIARVRSMAGHRSPTPARTAINPVIEEAMLFVQHEAEARGARMSLDLASGLPAVVVDRTQIQQVLINLIINAIQAMADAGDKRRDVLVTSRLDDAGSVQVTVSDSGPGIAPDDLGRLFDSFFTTKSSGMGMGLPLCRSIVEAHRGRIAAANAAGGGALFSFTLPGAPDCEP